MSWPTQNGSIASNSRNKMAIHPFARNIFHGWGELTGELPEHHHHFQHSEVVRLEVPGPLYISKSEFNFVVCLVCYGFDRWNGWFCIVSIHGTRNDWKIKRQTRVMWTHSSKLCIALITYLMLLVSTHRGNMSIEMIETD